MIWASTILVALQASGTPFWKAKEQFYRRIKEDRAVIVSVRTEKPAGGSGPESLLFAGGGWMTVPLEFAFQESMHFENLKSVIDYIEEIRFENERLFLRAKAYGFEAKMWLKITSLLNSDIHFEIVEGTLKGASGDIRFEKTGLEKTEIGLDGRFEYLHFPIPKMFAEFGIEVILQRMAIRFRSFLEELYKQKESAPFIPKGEYPKKAAGL